MSKSLMPRFCHNIVVCEAIDNYLFVLPLYKKFIRKHKLNYDAKTQTVLYCCFLANEEEKETVEREKRQGFSSGQVKEVIDTVMAESEKADAKKALHYLIHGDQVKYDKKSKLGLPDYLRVIDGDQPC